MLSPILLNFYSEEVIKKAPENEEIAEIKINDHLICDTSLIRENIDDLHSLLAIVSEEFSLSLNTNKTKLTIVTKKHKNLYVKQNYNYLRTNG